MTPRMKTRCGFTLIELLVVIAIICILLAILVPSLRWAKIVARRAVCTTNLSHQAKGVMGYAGEHKNRFPRHREFDSFQADGSLADAWFQKIAKYCPSERGFRCPELYQGQSDGGVDWEWDFNDNIGYGYNGFFLGNMHMARKGAGYQSKNWRGTGPMPGPFCDPFPVSMVVDPSRCMLIADTQPKLGSKRPCTITIWWPYASGNPGRRNFNEGVNGERHVGVGPIVYCDGHAEIVEDPQTNRNPPYHMSNINIEYWDPLMRGM